MHPLVRQANDMAAVVADLRRMLDNHRGPIMTDASHTERVEKLRLATEKWKALREKALAALIEEVGLL